MKPAQKRLRPESTVLIVIDIQDKLLAKIPTAASLVRSASFLLDVASELGVPIQAAEQYPKGLGPTTSEIARRLPQPISKTAFSCCGAGTFLEELEMLHRSHMVLVGMETHVCVMQTALDLLEAGLQVYLPVDALAARFTVDHEAALRRMEQAGAVPTSAEAIAFDWLRDATHPKFKAISQLIVSRVR